MGMESKYIWMNGELVEFEKATIHFLTPVIHYGVGVFEGIRCYATERGPAVFRLREHIERLVNSAQLFGFPQSAVHADELIEAIKLTVSANGFNECYIRPLVYLTDGGWNLNVDGGCPGCGDCRLGMEQLPGRGSPGKRGARQYQLVHPPPSQRDAHQGQGHRQLCQQRAGEDRIGAPGLR